MVRRFIRLFDNVSWKMVISKIPVEDKISIYGTAFHKPGAKTNRINLYGKNFKKENFLFEYSEKIINELTFSKTKDPLLYTIKMPTNANTEVSDKIVNNKTDPNKQKDFISKVFHQFYEGGRVLRKMEKKLRKKVVKPLLSDALTNKEKDIKILQARKDSKNPLFMHEEKLKASEISFIYLRSKNITKYQCIKK